jgi:hypothetical protein
MQPDRPCRAARPEILDFQRRGDARKAKNQWLAFQCGIADARKLADLLAFPARACGK